MKKIKERLDIIFQEVFNLPDFIPSLEMSAGDVEEWDSLSHAILIVSVEEHNIIGGLGSAISEFKSTLKTSPKQLFLGIKDTYSKGGTYNYLLNKHGLTSEKIVESVLLNLE